MNVKANSFLESFIRFFKKWEASKIVILVVAAAIVVLAVVLLVSQQKADNELVIQGSLQVTEVDLNSMLDGKVEGVLVEEGDQVKAGDLLIRLDTQTLLAKKTQAESAVKAAKGQYDAGMATYQKALTGTRSEDLAQAKSNYDFYSSNYNKVKSLYDAGAVSQSTYEQAKLGYESAKATYDKAQNGAQTEDIAAAKAAVDAYLGQVQQAQGALDEVNSYLKESGITAPIDGVVTGMNVSAGELISTGMSLATVSNYDEAWVEVNVAETYLSMFSEGDEIDVSLLAYPDDTYVGKIVSISKNPDFATKRATNNNGEFDVLSYCVKINIEGLDHDLYPGMSVIADFGIVPEALR